MYEIFNLISECSWRSFCANELPRTTHFSRFRFVDVLGAYEVAGLGLNCVELLRPARDTAHSRIPFQRFRSSMRADLFLNPEQSHSWKNFEFILAPIGWLRWSFSRFSEGVAPWILLCQM